MQNVHGKRHIPAQRKHSKYHIAQFSIDQKLTIYEQGDSWDLVSHADAIPLALGFHFQLCCKCKFVFYHTSENWLPHMTDDNVDNFFFIFPKKLTLCQCCEQVFSSAYNLPGSHKDLWLALLAFAQTFEHNYSASLWIQPFIFFLKLIPAPSLLFQVSTFAEIPFSVNMPVCSCK